MLSAESLRVHWSVLALLSWNWSSSHSSRSLSPLSFLSYCPFKTLLISICFGSRVLSRVLLPFNCAGFRCVFTRSFQTKRCILVFNFSTWNAWCSFLPMVGFFVPFLAIHCLIILSKILKTNWLITLFSWRVTHDFHALMRSFLRLQLRSE